MMKLSQAQKDLEELAEATEFFKTKYREAVRIGVEAVKTIKAERTIYGCKRLVRLPGETPE